MPYRMPTPCRRPGCGGLVQAGVCSVCGPRKQRPREDKDRPTARQRGYNTRWDKARAAYLASHPLCAECQRHGIDEPATLVDHVKPHRGDKRLFWDSDNWQALCTHCHAAKTARGE